MESQTVEHSYGPAMLTSIRNGSEDKHLDDLIDAIKKRRKAIAREATAGLEVGDKVRFSDVIRPKYLIGLEAVVVKINRESVSVDCPLDPVYRRYSGAKGVRCPNALIEPWV